MGLARWRGSFHSQTAIAGVDDDVDVEKEPAPSRSLSLTAVPSGPMLPPPSMTSPSGDGK